MPVLLRVFPQGLDARDAQQAAHLRETYEDWLERGAKQPSVHHAWIRHVLRELLGYPADWLAEGQAIPPGIQAVMANVGEVLRPDLILKHGDAQGKPILLVALYPPEQDLEKPISGKLWKATAGTRMMELLHASDLPLGLVTNGEEWTLVSAPRGETTGFASWYADLWMQEPLTLRAFQSLLHLRRLVGVAGPDTLPALFIESAKDQQEVTDQLGYQVRQAVEVLVQAFDRIDAEAGRTLLRDDSEKALYDGALTVMMRLVFLFSAEERGLLLLGDPLYDQNYAVSTLSALLREQADQHGEEVLERRHDAWCRLLATFRAVHGGVEHEAMRLPPYGGTLFDPDRYPFLEGRAGTSLWRDSPATPLLINNRVVLHLLEALQLLRVKVPGGGPAEARRLSFRALDIEQIGHVYEGLLDHTAKRAFEPVLGLAGSKDKEPEIPLKTLEEIAQKGTVALVEFLRDETGRSERALERMLTESSASDDHALLIACRQDDLLAHRVKPFAPLLRADSFGQLVVVPPGALYVTAGSDRRTTGTHYTPRSLTEPIVKHTLEPLVYVGPAEGLPATEWSLRTPKEILALKVCDMAMGSGAFLVETCRYLAERLVEAWENAEREHPGSFIVTPDGELSTGSPTDRLIPMDSSERVGIARRYITDRCLYGVDMNAMSVEMAKLSLWLITLQRDRPFNFLDHALKCGDSLMGVSTATQISNFSLRAGERQITFATAMLSRIIEEASGKRQALESLPSNDHAQIQTKTELNAEAEVATIELKLLADALIAFELTAGDGEAYTSQRTVAAAMAERVLTNKSRETTTPEFPKERKPFHWPIEFPEVFLHGGFAAFVGNPPFMGGGKISGSIGATYARYLHKVSWPHAHGNSDLVAYFFLRGFELLRPGGLLGLISTNTIGQGDTADTGLRWLIDTRDAQIVATVPTLVWPGAAAVVVSTVVIHKGAWAGTRTIDDTLVDAISPTLDASSGTAKPLKLQANLGLSSEGSKLYAKSFVLDESTAHRLLSMDANAGEVVRPFNTGEDFNSSPTQAASRWCIDFRSMSLEEVKVKWPATFAYAEKHVKPERATVSDPRARQLWWQHQRSREELYAAARKLERVLARALITRVWAFAFSDPRQVFANKLTVFVLSEFREFALLQSSFHEAWAWKWGSTMKTDLNYSHSDCFQTFPFPQELDSLSILGEEYHSHRSALMIGRNEGLTVTFKRFNDPDQDAPDITRLRELHVALDHAVAAAYGWEDLALDHDFHDTSRGVRFSIGEATSRAVIDRLLRLNHQRNADEVKAGLGTNSPGRIGISKSGAGRGRRASDAPLLR
jgi:hypothetical protein